MAAFRNFIAVSLALLVAAPLSAAAQSVQPATAAKSTVMATRWICVSRAVVEIAPVSYDTAGQPEGWVMVHRVRGEIVAAERVSDREVQKLRRLPCGKPDSDLGGVALVG